MEFKTLSQTQLQATTSHFCFSALLSPFLKARHTHTQANLGSPPKTPRPQPITPKTQNDKEGVRLPELPGFTGKNCLIASYPLLSSLYPLWILPQTREVNPSHDGLLQRYVVVFPCPVMAAFVTASIFLVAFAHYRELHANGNGSTLDQTECWREPLPSPKAGWPLCCNTSMVLQGQGLQGFPLSHKPYTMFSQIL